jgi:hypothetical protein
MNLHAKNQLWINKNYSTCFQFLFCHLACNLKSTLNFKSLVPYMFRPIWPSSGASKLMLESAALPSMCTIPNFTPFHASMCCTPHVIAIVLVFYIWSTLVFLMVWLDVCLIVVLGDYSYISCASVMIWLLYRVGGLYAAIQCSVLVAFQISDYVYQWMGYSYTCNVSLLTLHGISF